MGPYLNHQQALNIHSLTRGLRKMNPHQAVGMTSLTVSDPLENRNITLLLILKPLFTIWTTTFYNRSSLLQSPPFYIHRSLKRSSHTRMAVVYKWLLTHNPIGSPLCFSVTCAKLGVPTTSLLTLIITA